MTNDLLRAIDLGRNDQWDAAHRISISGLREGRGKRWDPIVVFISS
jgi:hypothetical protein